MSVTTYPLGSVNPQNYGAAVKQFGDRGGFANGLDPTIVGRIWYVNANSETDRAERKGPVGSNSNSGRSPFTPFATVARAFEFIDCYDVVIIDGVIREQVTAPLGVFDVTIKAAANLPRQATSGGVPTGGGATWLAPTSPTALTPLLQLREQGWIVDGIMFGTVASTASIRLKRQENATYPDASHAQIRNCYFATQGLSTEIAIGSESLFKSIIYNCRFQTISGTAILGESVAIAQPQNNIIDSCIFRQCANAIDWPQSYGVISNCRFMQTTTKTIDVNVGERNMIGINFFDRDQADITISNGFIGNADDEWRNYSKDTAAMTVGTPA